jgi:hypothetical protein
MIAGVVAFAQVDGRRRALDFFAICTGFHSVICDDGPPRLRRGAARQA